MYKFQSKRSICFHVYVRIPVNPCTHFERLLTDTSKNITGQWSVHAGDWLVHTITMYCWRQSQLAVAPLETVGLIKMCYSWQLRLRNWMSYLGLSKLTLCIPHSMSQLLDHLVLPRAIMTVCGTSGNCWLNQEVLRLLTLRNWTSYFG